MPTAAAAGVANPYWSATALKWFHDPIATGLSVGVTHVTSPAHPFAGSLGEYWVQFDGNQAHLAGSLKPDFFFGATESTTYPGIGGNQAPDTSHRWGLVNKWLFRVAAAPSSRARLCADGSGNGNGEMYLNTDLTLGLDLWDGSALTTATTSSAALATAINYQLELWELGTQWAGATDHQMLVRISTLSAGAQGTVTTLINGTWPVRRNTSFFGVTSPLQFGETTTRGASFLFYIGNIYQAWEDANDPYGIIRVDRLDPNAVSALNNQWTVVGALGANVDESGTAEPDDATTIDTVSVTSTTKDETYGLTDTVVATGSGDLVIRVVEGMRENATGTPPKGTFTRVIGLQSDGTNNQLGTNKTVTVSIGTYAGFYQSFDKNPAGAAWDTTSLNSLEVGLRAHTDSASAITYNNSAITTLVAYQANGETMPPVPGAPPKPPSIFVRQGVNRAGTY